MIETAVIPVAGLGTRLVPVTSIVPKAAFPLVDASGRVRCVLHWILAEAVAAGVRRAVVVVSPGQRELLERYFAAAGEPGPAELPGEIAYVEQPTPEGFGDAVLLARPAVGEAPMLLLLGDHVRVPFPGAAPCAAEVSAAFAERGGAAMVGMQPVGPEELQRVGVARGEPLGGGVYRCTDFIEKPDADTARRRLRTPGLPPERFLAHAGVYAFGSGLMDCLAELKASSGRSAGELQLADAQRMLLDRRPDDYRLLRIAGRALDTGTPEGFARTVEAFRKGPISSASDQAP